MNQGKGRKFPAEYVIAAGIISSIIVMRFLNLETGYQSSKNLLSFLRQMIFIIPCIFVLIGLMDVWVPGQWIQNKIGEGSGVNGSIYVVLLAAFQGGPLYGAFPVAHILWKKGCSMRNVFMYLGAFSTLKIPMMLFEANFLGWRFTLIRGAVALPVFVIIAEIMAIYARKKGLTMRELAENQYVH